MERVRADGLVAQSARRDSDVAMARGGALDFRLAAMCTSTAGAMLTPVSLRCLIVDDNQAFLAAAHAILQGPDLTVVSEATTVAEALQRADEHLPDVILIDIDLGGESGLALACELAERDRRPSPKLILISGHAEDDFAELVAATPALGFVAKSELSAGAVAELCG